jgi:hypothetical protein
MTRVAAGAFGFLIFISLAKVDKQRYRQQNAQAR